ncbi:MAG: Gfo/Idh/MocA family oxidoreductase, partial [Candidatus Latescibacteria bacterium]|nr:Gfo/Idh/MocA family oxidoreductase [Candidatus Latescibacterota bacterium]
MPDKIRLGFIGCGNMGQIAHIRNYAQLTDDCELVALAELRPELSKNVAERYGISEVYSDHQTMLAEAEIDAVVAIMYYGIHYTVVPDVLSAGKHLITEKPMGCDPLTALQWKSLADENDLVYLVGYMKRWDVAARHLAERVKSLRESGELGQLRYLRCNMSGTDWTWNNEPAIRATEKIES